MHCVAFTFFGWSLKSSIVVNWKTWHQLMGLLLYIITIMHWLMCSLPMNNTDWYLYFILYLQYDIIIMFVVYLRDNLNHEMFLNHICISEYLYPYICSSLCVRVSVCLFVCLSALCSNPKAFIGSCSMWPVKLTDDRLYRYYWWVSWNTMTIKYCNLHYYSRFFLPYNSKNTMFSYNRNLCTLNLLKYEKENILLCMCSLLVPIDVTLYTLMFAWEYNNRVLA